MKRTHLLFLLAAAIILTSHTTHAFITSASYHGVLAVPSSAFNYYVDSVDGNDAADGKSPSQAVQSLAALSGLVHPGQRIGVSYNGTSYSRLDIAYDSLGGYWPLIQGTDAQVVYDKSGLGRNLTNGSTTGVDADDFTWLNWGARFDGTQFASRANYTVSSDGLTVLVQGRGPASATLMNVLCVGFAAPRIALTNTDATSIYWGSAYSTNSFLVRDGEYHVGALVFGGGKVRVFYDGAFVSQSDLPDGKATTDVLYLAKTLSAVNWWTGDLSDVAIWPVALSDAQAIAASTYVRHDLNHRIFGRVMFDGDSLTYGTGLTASQKYPSQVVAGMRFDGLELRWSNLGVEAQRLVEMTSDVGTQIVPMRDKTFQRDVVVAWGGTNDLYLGAFAATVEDRFAPYFDPLRTAGFKTVVLTVLPRSGGSTPAGFEAERQALNTWLRANYASFADVLVDVAADSRIGDAGDELDLAYYQSDKVHLNGAGAGVVAGLVKTAIEVLP